MSHEREYFDVLKRIARNYHPSEWYEKNAELAYGLTPHEALEMAYDNMQEEAADTIRGRKRPKP